MFYVAIYNEGSRPYSCGLVYSKPETIWRETRHLQQKYQPVAVVFASTKAELNPAIKAALSQMRIQCQP